MHAYYATWLLTPKSTWMVQSNNHSMLRQTVHIAVLWSRRFLLNTSLCICFDRVCFYLCLHASIFTVPAPVHRLSDRQRGADVGLVCHAGQEHSPGEQSERRDPRQTRSLLRARWRQKTGRNTARSVNQTHRFVIQCIIWLRIFVIINCDFLH